MNGKTFQRNPTPNPITYYILLAEMFGKRADTNPVQRIKPSQPHLHVKRLFESDAERMLACKS